MAAATAGYIARCTPENARWPGGAPPFSALQPTAETEVSAGANPADARNNARVSRNLFTYLTSVRRALLPAIRFRYSRFYATGCYAWYLSFFPLPCKNC